MILLLFVLSYTITDIDVDTRWTDPDLIIEASGLETGKELGPTDLQNAVENISRLKLFNFVAVDTSIVSDGVFITITVEEVPFLKSKPTFIGNRKIKDKDLDKEINLRVGQVLTENTVFASKTKISELYKEKSFYNTSVTDSIYIDSLNKAALFFLIDEGIEPRIGTIVIEGNTEFTDNAIRKMMKNRPKAFLRAGTLDEDKLKEDVDKIESEYKKKGYLDVVVEEPKIEVEDDMFVITITVIENRRYYVGDISYDGNSIFGSKDLDELRTLQPGDIYDLTKAQETYQAFGQAYADEGYIWCRIIPNETVRDTIIDIKYNINEGTPANINRVIITGNYNTHEKVIRRELVTVPGERYRLSDVFRSAREVFNLGFFDDILPQPSNPDDSGNIDLIYQVKEKEGVAKVGAGISYSAQDKLTGYFELTHPNLMGRGQNLYTKFEIGGRLTNFQIGFTEPWLFDTRTSAGMDIYYTNRFWDYYTKRDIGFATRVSFPFYLDYTRFGYTFRTERTQVLDISSTYTPPTTGYSLYQDTIPRWTVANTFSITRDSRDYIFNPSSGTFLAARAEIAKKFLFANVDYNQFIFEARAYFPLFWKFVLMGRLKAGVVTSVDEVPLYKRFYAGGIGDYGVRGYPDRSLSPTQDGRTVGGTAVFINNIELKMKLSQTFAFLLFYDAGNAFESHYDVNLQNIYRGVGAGVRLEIPMMGVLGFDVGYGLDREIPGFEPHFQINPLGMFR
ncbi:MAG: outer membrane protein assembly factor BamA [candidate division WOR-3 bacterium]|nr:MAG: outer membrane protein assembly factor BamA [candidate division WOR-3 bacterium]